MPVFAHRLLFLALLLPCVATSVLAQPSEAMLRWVPSGANAIVVVNVRDLTSSQLGQREGWAQRHEKDFLAGAARIPTSANLAVMATEMCLDTGARSWEVGILQLDRNVPMTDISRREGSTISIIGGERAIYAPHNAIFVELDRRILGVRQPADRQATAQWLKEARAGQDRNAFLTGLVTSADRRAQVLLAIDLREIHTAEEIARGLNNSELLKGMETDAQALARFLAGVQSLRLAITVTSRMEGQLQVDFSSSPQPFVNLLKPLLLGVLDRMEIPMADFVDWQPAVQGNSFTLSGPVSTGGLRRVLSIIEPYMADLSESDSPGDAKQVMADTSQRYFRALTTLLDDLRAQYTNVRTVDQSGAWFDRFAAKIDALPTLNVDPELVQFALSLSGKMRALAASLRGIPLTNSVLDMHRQSQFAVIPPTFASHWGGGWGGWGWGGWGGWGGGFNTFHQPGSVWYTDNYREIWAKQRENVKRGVMDRTELWKIIDNETAAIRARMTQKYGRPF